MRMSERSVTYDLSITIELIGCTSGAMSCEESIIWSTWLGSSAGCTIRTLLLINMMID